MIVDFDTLLAEIQHLRTKVLEEDFVLIFNSERDMFDAIRNSAPPPVTFAPGEGLLTYHVPTLFVDPEMNPEAGKVLKLDGYLAEAYRQTRAERMKLEVPS